MQHSALWEKKRESLSSSESSKFAENLHDSEGCALSKDEGSNYNRYDSPSC